MNPTSFRSIQQQASNCDIIAPGVTPIVDHIKSICKYDGPKKIFTTQKSYIRRGGSDPLDYVYVFKNDQKSELVHWHYVSLGLSDIHLYNNFYKILNQAKLDPETASKVSAMYPCLFFPPDACKENLNGFGFELTLRLKCDSEIEPPEWPAQLLQELARYVFGTKNIIKPGDHIRWRGSLDNEESRIEHMLMTQDTQLPTLETPSGMITFVQIVGACQEELQIAREWTVSGLLNLMRRHTETGDDLLVTDMRRGSNLLEIDPECRLLIDQEIDRHGSDLAQISTRHKFSAKNFIDHELAENEEPGERNPSRMSCQSIVSQSQMLIENVETVPVMEPENVFLTINKEAAEVLSVALKRRLAVGRIFALQSPHGDLLTTFVPESQAGRSLVSTERPLAKQANWLQIFVPKILLNDMIVEMVEHYGSFRGQTSFPVILSWPTYKLHIKIIKDPNTSHETST